MAGGSCSDGSCYGGCYGNCHGGCEGNCWGGCSTGCFGTCSGCSGTCTSGCSGTCSGCGGTCTGTCSGCSGCGGCGSGCSGGCTSCSGSCSGTCRGGCRGSCNNLCNTACTAADRAEFIANLGSGITKGKAMYAQDILDVKNSIVGEFTRRGRTGYTTYTVIPAENVPVLLEHGKKILEDCYNFDNTKDWRNWIRGKGVIAEADSLKPAIDYIKTLMNTVVPVA